ncbi:DUF5677 domain-containing protein [Cryobacterium sp. GrIS_2_6]|uniref:DUF5677 domain-containing protein n=1 Tax=Cryobacterium sp. GrIS_2_6 TaxID=3162785 RepID=UPI002E000CEA|nr:hypothetical protein [Cryobacterium psychrotolerans]
MNADADADADADAGVQVPMSERAISVLRQLVSIWDEVCETQVPVLEDGDWERGVSARVQVEHAVGLTRAVLILAEAGLRIESVPLVRLTLECAVTAVWLATTPGSGKASYYQSTKDFGTLNKALLDINNKGMDEDLVTEQIEEDIKALAAFRQKEAKVFIDRCGVVDSGVWLYAYYRLFSKTSHGGANLNDEYLADVGHSDLTPLGLAFKDPQSFSLWPITLGFQVTMLFHALQAWDRISSTRPRKAALGALSKEHHITLFDRLPH